MWGSRGSIESKRNPRLLAVSFNTGVCLNITGRFTVVAGLLFWTEQEELRFLNSLTSDGNHPYIPLSAMHAASSSTSLLESVSLSSSWVSLANEWHTRFPLVYNLRSSRYILKRVEAGAEHPTFRSHSGTQNPPASPAGSYCIEKKRCPDVG